MQEGSNKSLQMELKLIWGDPLRLQPDVSKTVLLKRPISHKHSSRFHFKEKLRNNFNEK
jgi:hypothetical protein